MEIRSQDRSALLLCAPKIAGLLPAQAVSLNRDNDPTPEPFIYADPCLSTLSDKTRAELDNLLTTMIKATVGLLADELTEAEFAIANGTFVRQVTALYRSTIIGDPKPVVTSPFASRRQQLDEKLEAMVEQSKIHLAETRERVARELAALHTDSPRPRGGRGAGGEGLP